MFYVMAIWVGSRNLPHPIISCTCACTYNDCKFRNVGTCYCGHELCTVLGYATLFGIGANHEAAYVLEEDKGNVALAAELDEVCAFEG